MNSCLKKTRAGELNDSRVVIVSTKLSFQNVFRSHENEKPAFLNSSDLKSIFEKLRFLDGLVWTVGLTKEIKLRLKFVYRSIDAALTVLLLLIVRETFLSKINSSIARGNKRVANFSRYRRLSFRQL